MDYRTNPQGLLEYGLAADGIILDGVGLQTFGFVWSCYSPFIGVSMVASTSWSMVSGTSSTIWTGVTGPMWGPC